ncbi:hypothetical protein J7M23_08410 [Candidatus Sumerlaeota bacterium]|nr:hypothetical protein [Candidatus Sumerlaeota bacterium]
MKKVIFILIVSVVFAMLCCLQGCVYLKNRAGDAMDMIDIGFTFSKKPQFAFFYDFVPVVPIGYGNVEGYYVGLGGRKFGFFSPHYERSYGLILYGAEEVGFGNSVAESELKAMSEEERHKLLNFQRSGLAGMVVGPFPGPKYLISCPHYIHLGWIGAVGTPRYLQMLDFILGWTTLDIYFDDDAKMDNNQPAKPITPVNDTGN